MKTWLRVLICALAISLPACTKDGAKELYETAQLEELQNNPAHAKELYREILRKYPDSELAKKAGERLKALEGGR